MKLMNVTITAITLFAISLADAEAGNRQVGGLIIGGSTGAIVGQAVGHNAEATILGAAVGGAVGFIIGNELDRHHHGSVDRRKQVVIYSPPHPHRRGPDFRNNHRDYPQYRYGKDACSKTVVIKKGHRQTKQIVSTVCNNGPRQHYKKDQHYRQNGRFYR